MPGVPRVVGELGDAGRAGEHPSYLPALRMSAARRSATRCFEFCVHVFGAEGAIDAIALIEVRSQRPSLGSGQTAVPHEVLMQIGGQTQDRIVWEIQGWEQLPRWLAGLGGEAVAT